MTFQLKKVQTVVRAAEKQELESNQQEVANASQEREAREAVSGTFPAAEGEPSMAPIPERSLSPAPQYKKED